ncbi:unnamed protein product [Calypogeia fissa]
MSNMSFKTFIIGLDSESRQWLAQLAKKDVIPMAVIRDWSEFFMAALATVAMLLLAFVIRRKRNSLLQLPLPPGPRGWPILGSLPLLGTLPHQSLYKMSKKYGPLMYLKLGSVPAIVVSSPKLAEKILRTHDSIMSSRPVQIVGNHLSYGGIDVAMSPYGETWRYLRRICSNGLLTPVRITQFKEIRRQEVMEGLYFILEESQKGNPVDMAEFFAIVNVNNMTQMMMNKSYCIRRSSSSSAAAQATMSTFQEIFQEVFVLLGSFNLADYVPLVRPFDLQGFNKRVKVVHQKLSDFLDKVIEEHRQKLHIGSQEDYKEDFVDALIGLGETKEFQDRLSMDTIKAMLGDMLAGASDTTAVVSQWTLTELMRHPHLMKRVQQELDSVIGPNRLVQEEDIPDLKYLQAVIKEGFRLHPPGPMLIPHESTEDCEIEGFHVPAKSRIFVNQWAIHRDPAFWERPQEFDPDRFVNSNIDVKGQNFQYLPFGAGRRMCPGWNLGLLMVTYALATLLHAVDFSPSEGEKPEELDISETFGLVLYKKFPLKVFGKARLPTHVIYPDKKNVQNGAY